ncbi:NAD(P)/FAD-dependent oxidoreductase [[Eubacterium] hominis]|uniref:NAD(P)/FAD-dependent oxidoreductase n=1 Tax=[Eubacterium] hominis TaxID=2764325 RepID=UPI003A4E34C5
MKKIIIIGGGIVGCFLAHDLSKYEVDITLLERNADICDEISSANSAIIHAGYDPEDGTLKANLNCRGAKLYPNICASINADYQRCGAYIVACGEQEEQRLQTLKIRGEARGITMIPRTRAQLLEKEPHLSLSVSAGLSVPETAIITPWEVGLGLIQEAVLNHVTLKLSEAVIAIKKQEEGYIVQTTKAIYPADIVINAAGLGAAHIMEMVEEKPLFTITPKRGQYFVLSKHANDYVHHILYPVPGPTGKGVLCLPTCHGNILLGPNSEVLMEQNNATTADGLNEVKEKLKKTMQDIPYQEVIHSYSGLRPSGNHNDFFIQHSPNNLNFIHLGCIDSPGLASAPAISEYVLETLILPHHNLKYRTMYHHHKLPIRLKDLTENERQALIQQKSGYGHIICRCEQISEQEVIDHIHEPFPAKTIKEIKKRVRPGMGKCQGGFCEIEVATILARELGIPLHEVAYDKTTYFMESKGVRK